jgi:hypothetical protein
VSAGVSLTGTNVTLDAAWDGIYATMTTNWCFSNIVNLVPAPGMRRFTVHFKPTNNFIVSWYNTSGLVGAFTTNGLAVGASNGYYTMAVECYGTNWNTNTCVYAIAPPNN